MVFNPPRVLLEAMIAWDWSSLASPQSATVGTQCRGVTCTLLCTRPLQMIREVPKEPFSLLQASQLQWGSPSPTHPQRGECLCTRTHMTLHPNPSQNQDRTNHRCRLHKNPMRPALAPNQSSLLSSFNKLRSWHGTQLVPWITRMSPLLS